MASDPVRQRVSDERIATMGARAEAWPDEYASYFPGTARQPIPSDLAAWLDLREARAALASAEQRVAQLEAQVLGMRDEARARIVERDQRDPVATGGWTYEDGRFDAAGLMLAALRGTRAPTPEGETTP